MMQRRKFLKTSCTVCVGTLAGITAISLLESCATGKIVKSEISNDTITIALSEFEQGKSYIIVRNSNLTYDILLNKINETSYKALLMQCTHYDNPVFANSKEIFCPSHGSKFDFNGNVKQEPATTSLKTYKTELKDQIITIFLK